jgi:hypothetical protein
MGQRSRNHNHLLEKIDGAGDVVMARTQFGQTRLSFVCFGSNAFGPKPSALATRQTNNTNHEILVSL